MVINTMVNGLKVRSMAEVYISLLVVTSMKVIGLLAREMEEVYTSGMMAQSIMEIGKMIKCMEEVPSPLRMEPLLRVSSEMTRRSIEL